MLVCETPHVIPWSMTTRGLWRQVQLSRGNWRREDAAGAIRSEDGGSR
jgi:hypothetical protein